jgi:hypothetical protein
MTLVMFRTLLGKSVSWVERWAVRNPLVVSAATLHDLRRQTD